jgi:tetratricopeptide (TPR) repeat protein
MSLKIDKYTYILIAVSIVSYSPILFNGFTYYSDDNYVLNNPLIKRLSISNIELIFTSFFDGHYHPLTMLSLAINYFFSGDTAFGYQLTNLSFNTINSVLVYILLGKIFKNNTTAFAAALLFALHPLHVESVARITERKDTLYGFFFLLSCISYISFINTREINKYALSTLFFVLALLSKGQAVTLPLTLFVISILFLGLKETFRQAKYILPLLILSGIFGFLNLKAQTYTGYYLDTSSIPLSNYFISAGYVLTNYIFKLFIPLQLSPHYPYPFNLYELVPYSFYLYLLVFPALILLIFKLRKNYILLFGVLFYLVNIILMIRFIPVAENVMPDRYNYIASIGFVVILVVILEKYLKSRMMTVIYIISTLFFIKTITQTKVWKDGVQVWETVYRYYPNDSEINQILGSHYMRKGNASKATKYLDRAIQLDTNNILAYLDRSTLNNGKQDYKGALNDLSHVINFPAKSERDLSNQSAVLLKLGRFDDALKKINMAIEKNIYNAKLYYNKSAILLLNKKYDDALESADQCIKLRPHFIGDVHLLKVKIALYNNNGVLAQKELNEAKRYLSKTKELENAIFVIENYLTYESSLITVKDAKKLNAIGLIYFDLGYYGLAIDYFNKAIELMENYSPAYQNLVYAYYMQGNWEETAKEYKRAKLLNIQIDNRINQQLLNLEID